MLKYIATRLLYTIAVIWLVVSVVFLLIHTVPGDPIQQMLGEGAPAADVQAARHAYGLDLPLGRQYLNYWKGVLRGDLLIRTGYVGSHGTHLTGGQNINLPVFIPGGSTAQNVQARRPDPNFGGTSRPDARPGNSR